MTMDILDNISELEITLKKEAAVLEAFMNEYTNRPEKEALIAISTHFEGFVYMAHVISDLMCDAKEQVATLGEAADKEWKNTPEKCG